jgi:hypothetical protein
MPINRREFMTDVCALGAGLACERPLPDQQILRSAGRTPLRFGFDKNNL